MKNLGFSGAKTLASFVESDVNGKAIYPCCAKVEELGVPILVHTGSAIPKGVRAKYVHPY